MSRTYQEWIAWLEQKTVMPLVRPGLKNTQTALAESGILAKVSPQKVIHVAGTNGKGTTAKTLEHLLLKQGHSVGLYTSPHLVDTCERIRINGKTISQDQMVAYFEKYEPLIEKLNLSHFESLTLFAASLFFVDQPVDYAIYEIGLGGTWDATNAIPHQTSVITTLGFDHQHILGPTLKHIADNKFGIIQNKNDVFHNPYDTEIESLLIAKSETTGAKIHCVLPPEISIRPNKPLADYGIIYKNQFYKISLPGYRAAQNMWLALHVFEHLGFSIQTGLSYLNEIQWPARMTLWECTTVCPVYLSGDHNLQGLESLKEILQHSSYRRVKVLFGLSKNRKHETFLKTLSTFPRADLFLTKPHFGGVEPESTDLPYNPNPLEALDNILKTSSPEDLVVVTGSLYLCGDILRG